VLLTYPQDPASASQARVETAGTGSIASPSHPGPEKVRLGVLGAGNFATAVMLPALKENPAIERVAIASASGLNARHAARRYQFGYASASDEQILGDPAINTVAILTRHDLHASRRSLPAGGTLQSRWLTILRRTWNQRWNRQEGCSSTAVLPGE
jgi:hypothetical protein